MEQVGFRDGCCASGISGGGRAGEVHLSHLSQCLGFAVTYLFSVLGIWAYEQFSKSGSLA